MKVLVIGGAGYIGSHVVLALLDAGYQVTVFDNLSSGSKLNIQKEVSFINGDILNKSDLRKTFNTKFDSVIHLAGLKSVSESIKNPVLYYETNVKGSINILNAMVVSGVKNLVFSSSASVYGNPTYVPVDESHQTKPINYYGCTKLIVEKELEVYRKKFGINFVSLRYFNAAGYDLNKRILDVEKSPANLIPIVMETMVGDRGCVEIYGGDYETPDGTCIRDYVHVTDISIAHLKSIEYIKKKEKSLIVNLSTGMGTSVKEVIERVGKNLQYSISDRRDGDPKELVASNKKAFKNLKWVPRFSDIETIIESMKKVYIK